MGLVHQFLYHMQLNVGKPRTPEHRIVDGTGVCRRTDISSPIVKANCVEVVEDVYMSRGIVSI
jgi:hypothetical protein